MQAPSTTASINTKTTPTHLQHHTQVDEVAGGVRPDLIKAQCGRHTRGHPQRMAEPPIRVQDALVLDPAWRAWQHAAVQLDNLKG